MPIKKHYIRAILLTLLLLFTAFISVTLILFPASPDTDEVTIADIYHNGSLLQTISLTDIKENYVFTVTGENGATNEIEVHPGSIGIISASCPDKLCVHQGFITNSQLPITCLPNRVVIQVRTVRADNDDSNTIYETLDDKGINGNAASEITPDIVTY